MSVISNVISAGGTNARLLPCASLLVISAKSQFLGQVKINSTSQLINGVFKTFQKLLKCYSGITISVSFLPTLFASYPSSSCPTLSVFPVILVFYLKDSELEERGLLGSSL